MAREVLGRWAITFLLLVLLVIGGLAQGVTSGPTPAAASIAVFEPPWTIFKTHSWGDKKGGGTDLVHRVTLITDDKTPGGGNFYIRGDTHTTLRERWAKAQASFLLGGTFVPPATGRYRFVFHYSYSGEAKFQMRGHRFRFRGTAAIMASVGETCAVAQSLCAHSDRGGKDEQEELVKATLSAVEAVGSLVGADPRWVAGFVINLGDALLRVIKVFEGKSFTIPLRGTETLEVFCDLEKGKSYPFFMVVAGTIYAKAEDASKAEARINLEVKLQRVEVFRQP